MYFRCRNEWGPIKDNKWSIQDLQVDKSDVQDKNSLLENAAAAHWIPKSILYDHASGKIEVGSWWEPYWYTCTVLTITEEDNIVEFVMNFSIIAYGWMKERVTNIVKNTRERSLTKPFQQ